MPLLPVLFPDFATADEKAYEFSYLTALHISIEKKPSFPTDVRPGEYVDPPETVPFYPIVAPLMFIMYFPRFVSISILLN